MCYKVSGDQTVNELHSALRDLCECYSLNQAERSEFVKKKEEMQKGLAEIELFKARALMNDEIEHKRTMMRLEVEAKRAEIEKWRRSD